MNSRKRRQTQSRSKTDAAFAGNREPLWRSIRALKETPVPTRAEWTYPAFCGCTRTEKLQGLAEETHPPPQIITYTRSTHCVNKNADAQADLQRTTGVSATPLRVSGSTHPDRNPDPPRGPATAQPRSREPHITSFAIRRPRRHSSPEASRCSYPRGQSIILGGGSYSCHSDPDVPWRCRETVLLARPWTQSPHSRYTVISTLGYPLSSRQHLFLHVTLALSLPGAVCNACNASPRTGLSPEQAYL